MSYILSISASSRQDSSNTQLLKAIDKRYSCKFEGFNIHMLPLFSPGVDHHPWPEEVLLWRRAVQKSSAVIFTTPVYLFNIPAALKNALEWITTSGELTDKRVLPITYTPHPPRGEKAMQSLLWSLKALNARIVAQVSLFQSELNIDSNLNIIGVDSIEILDAAIELLK